MIAVPAASRSGREVRGRAVGQGQEDGIHRRQLAVDGQLGRAEVRVDAGDRVVVAFATLEADEVARSGAGRAGG